MGAPAIRKMVREDLPAFFLYLDDHVSDNGSAGTALFMPIARSESRFTPDKQAAFRSALETPWRVAGIYLHDEKNNPVQRFRTAR